MAYFGYTDTYGGNPGGSQPYYIPGQQRGTGLGGNVTGAVPGLPGGTASIESITNLVNEINQAAQQKANAGRIPGGAGLEQQSSSNIGNALGGVLDPSVINNIAQGAAERGVMRGSPTAPNSNADYLRALGLTTLDLQNRGQQWLTEAQGRNPAAPIYNAGNQVLTAEQVQQAILERERMANAMQMARMHWPGNSGGGGFSGGNVGGVGRTATNYGDLLTPTRNTGGWSFPPGYSSIPVGGNQGGVTDQQFMDYWFPDSVDYNAVGSPVPGYMDPNYSGDYTDYFGADYTG